MSKSSKAAELAHYLGLTPLRYGRWADQSGRIVAQTHGDRLVRVVPRAHEIEQQTALDAQKAREKDDKEREKAETNPTPAPSSNLTSPVDKPPVEHKPTGMSAVTAGKVKDNTPGKADIEKINGTSKSIDEASHIKRQSEKLSDEDLAELEHYRVPPDGDLSFVPYGVKSVTPPHVVFNVEVPIPSTATNGKWWIGEDKKLRHVKYYETDDTHGFCEHLANSIYCDLGLPVAISLVFTYGPNGSAHSSEYVRGPLLNKFIQDKNVNNSILDGFAADVLLANWDVLGPRLENIVVDRASGYPIRVDAGGSLLFRGVNKRKDRVVSQQVLENIAEWDKFSTELFPGYCRVFKAAGVKDGDALGARAVRQIDRILDLQEKSGGWRRYVLQVCPKVNPTDQKAIIRMLDNRTILLAEKRESILQGL